MNNAFTLQNIADLEDVMNNYPLDDFDTRVSDDEWIILNESIKNKTLALCNASIGKFVFKHVHPKSADFELESSSCTNSHIKFTWGCIVDFVNRVIENPELLKDYKI